MSIAKFATRNINECPGERALHLSKACHNEPEETATRAHMAKDFWFGHPRLRVRTHSQERERERRINVYHSDEGSKD